MTTRLTEVEAVLQQTRESLNPVPVAYLVGREVDSLSAAEKMALARDFFLTGNLSEIARQRGISYNDLLELAREPWFIEEVKNLDREANAITKVKLTNLFGKTLTELEERLAEGDWKITKDGRQVRIPVGARDLSVIASVIFDKKKALEESASGFGTVEAKKLRDLASVLRAVPVEGERLRDTSPPLANVVCKGIVPERDLDSIKDARDSLALETAESMSDTNISEAVPPVLGYD